jgi:hypothetical protein
MATSTNHHERSAGSLPESSKPTSLEAPKRRRRYTCPKVTQRTRPKRISAKANHGGRCDYIGPDGNICSHWQAPDSDACWCHFDAYNARSGVEMPYPRTTKSRSGGWKKKKPTVAVKMTPNELSKPPEWYQRPYQ